ncbi:MAG: hypothetical protein IPJ32_17690 [Sphingobacteriaceae bacterium]|nr:hypothetical protein [Sphingobacteriaceae bacterium]
MKKHLFSFLSIILVSGALAQSIPNGGFESWTLNTYENPQFYNTSNYQYNGGSNGYQTGLNALKTTDAYHGNYAIKLLTSLSGTMSVWPILL